MNVEVEIVQINAKLFAIRAVVSRLLAFVAARHESPDDVFREISEGIEGILLKHSNEAVFDLEEVVRKEIDWFITAARSWLTAT